MPRPCSSQRPADRQCGLTEGILNLEPKGLRPGTLLLGSPGGASGKESACNAEDTGDVVLILGSGRSPGGGKDNPVQYSWLENSMDKGAWRALVHGLAKSWTELSTSTKFISNVFSPNHHLFPGPTHSQSDAEWCCQTHSRSHLFPYFRAF